MKSSKLIKIHIGIAVLFMMPTTIRSQALQFVLPDFYTNRIKTIDHFMQRFNREDIPVFLDSTDAELPYKQIITCFCIDSVRHRGEDVIEFAHKMVNENVRLDYAMQNYYCELECSAKYGKESTTIIIRMVVEKSPQDFYSWVIADAEGEVLTVAPNRTSPKMKLSPADNERYFLDLRDVLNEHPDDILNYTFSGWTIDQTSTFMALVANKMLKMESIKNMRYVFDAGGYTFKVQCIDRESNNNGWLIYDFKKNEQE